MILYVANGHVCAVLFMQSADQAECTCGFLELTLGSHKGSGPHIKNYSFKY